jgi:hypothetical protein
MITKSFAGALFGSLLIATALTPVPGGAADMTNERALNPQREPQNWISRKALSIVQSTPAASNACPAAKSSSRKSGSMPPMTYSSIGRPTRAAAAASFQVKSPCESIFELDR